MIGMSLENKARWSAIYAPVKERMLSKVRGIDQVARLIDWKYFDAKKNYVRFEESRHNSFENGFVYADPEWLDILEVPMLYGDRYALQDYRSVVISERVAQRYFPFENPIDKKIILNNESENYYVIKGVIKNQEKLTHFNYDFILSLSEFEFYPGEQMDWCCWKYEYFLKLSPNIDRLEVERNLKRFYQSEVAPIQAENESVDVQKLIEHTKYILQPIDDVYLNRYGVLDNQDNHASFIVISLLGATACLVLVLSALTFINLTINRNVERHSINVKKIRPS